VKTQNFQRGLRVRKKLRRHENESERHGTRAELRAQFLRPRTQAIFIKVILPVGGGGKFTVHESSLTPPRAIANFLRCETDFVLAQIFSYAVRQMVSTAPIESAKSERSAAKMPRRPELLAPAGDWECAKAAVENGADAIYFGLEKFNARMRAHNFTEADLPKLMEFLHRRGVKGYVTFNTLVFENELADAENYLRAIISAGVRFSDPRLDTNDRDERRRSRVCPRTRLQSRRARARMFN
jgi:hypothetical protein